MRRGIVFIFVLIFSCSCPLFLLLLFLFLSFTPLFYVVRDESKLYGTYVADYEFAKEKLTINKDGTFVQEVALKTPPQVDMRGWLPIWKGRMRKVTLSKADTATGTWTYYVKPTTSYFMFDHNFMCVMVRHRDLNPDYAQPRDTGIVTRPAHRWLFRIYIGSSEAVLYRKID